jgi:hypothetical protein
MWTVGDVGSALSFRVTAVDFLGGQVEGQDGY